ncbi:MAG: PaaI family thioesterase [Candidatus Competibacterales bacterium]|nr:PaaI family thioesterase [Candidatus Competibacterales bacterium]
MQPRNPEYAEITRRILEEAPFIRALGVEVAGIAPGRVETLLPVAPWHTQHDGYVHAGVQATLADHTAGAAASTLMAADEMVLTAEFKLNLLRLGQGERLLCVGSVLKPGRRLTVAEAEVHGETGGERLLIAKATVTLVLLSRARGTQ